MDIMHLIDRASCIKVFTASHHPSDALIVLSTLDRTQLLHLFQKKKKQSDGSKARNSGFQVGKAELQGDAVY